MKEVLDVVSFEDFEERYKNNKVRTIFEVDDFVLMDVVLSEKEELGFEKVVAHILWPDATYKVPILQISPELAYNLTALYSINASSTDEDDAVVDEELPAEAHYGEGWRIDDRLYDVFLKVVRIAGYDVAI